LTFLKHIYICSKKKSNCVSLKKKKKKIPISKKKKKKKKLIIIIFKKSANPANLSINIYFQLLIFSCMFSCAIPRRYKVLLGGGSVERAVVPGPLPAGASAIVGLASAVVVFGDGVAV
jgi:hypothetical protein